MDNLFYIAFTKNICLISLIGLIFITLIFIGKKEAKPINVALFLIFFIGTYLYLPMKLVSYGYLNQNPKTLKIAKKLSINPYEKRLCCKYLAEIYADDIFYQGIKDGSKAIEYMEKALKGEYSKYRKETKLLAYWYSIKGDEEKTFELMNTLNIDKNIALRNIYIMKDEYKLALSTFDNNTSVENYLKADLYKKIGDIEASKRSLKIAQETYNSKMDNIKIRAKKLSYKEEVEKYKSIDAYKNWIMQQRKEFSFN